MSVAVCKWKVFRFVVAFRKTTFVNTIIVPYGREAKIDTVKKKRNLFLAEVR